MLIVFDAMLPGIDGFEVLKRLRQTSKTPILILTTRGAAMDRVHGLENGADDYLAKPFQPEELVARIKAILRGSIPNIAAAKLMLPQQWFKHWCHRGSRGWPRHSCGKRGIDLRTIRHPSGETRRGGSRIRPRLAIARTAVSANGGKIYAQSGSRAGLAVTIETPTESITS
jgi:chemotaxis response regulator CheB